MSAIVRIDHVRCGERAATTWMIAPSEWDREEITRRAQEAKKAYLAALPAAREDPPPLKVGKKSIRYSPHGKPDYEAFPGHMMLNIVKHVWEEHRPVYEAWAERDRETRKRFTEFLEAQGFKDLWDAVPYGEAIEVDWGHRHGQSVGYDETELDDWPTPRLLAKAIAYVRENDPEFEPPF